MSLKPKTPAFLALSDGTIAHGWSIGIEGTCGGELCFNTSMTGYQEIFTDPSYFGQLMMMTYPHIGNYGTNSRDDESSRVMVSGIIVRDFSTSYSNPQADASLNDYLIRHRIVGIAGVDTRQLVRHIRSKGVMNAIITTESLDSSQLIDKAKAWVSMEGLELASKVGCSEAYTLPGDGGYRIAALDFGIKQNILNNFVQRKCTVRVFPAKANYAEIKEWNPDGLFLSNGPGDPNPMDYALETIKAAKQDGLPLFGICLGHQLLALSEGMKVDKMFVGHRGANHPVKNNQRQTVEITTQNHGFSVNPDSISADRAEITHINLNDGTIEGLSFKRFNGFAVQYHPEASPGPHDSSYLFDHFIQRISESKR